jgi:hypothetical protein
MNATRSTHHARREKSAPRSAEIGARSIRFAAFAVVFAVSTLCDAARAGFECGEGFASVDMLWTRGWIARNDSDPLGTTGWFQGNPTVFTAWAGAPNSYIAADADNAAATQGAFVSNWLITPEIVFGPNDLNVRIFDFYTRAVPGAANRLVVRLCIEDASEHCDAPGPGPTDLGGFTTTLLSINPDLSLDGFPDQWTEYTLTPADGLPVVGRGRIAFHYDVPTQPDSTHGTYIGIDAVTMAGANACPFTDVVFESGFD